MFKLFYPELFYPEKTSRISDHFFVIKSIFTNVFLFSHGDDSFCIDAGYGPKSLSNGFVDLGLDPQSIGAVFLTHSDFDHVGGLSLFPNAAIYLNENEEPLIDGRTTRFLGCVHNRKISGHRVLFSPGQMFHIGPHKIEAISTPGHTPGHTAYLVDDFFLFTGDSLIIRKGSFQPLVSIINKDHGEAVKSVELIKNLIRDLNRRTSVCTSHFGIYDAWE